MSLSDFVSRITGFSSFSQSKKADFFSYYLQKYKGKKYLMVADILSCFEEVDFHPHSRLDKYLSDCVSRKNKYVKKEKGYRLERSMFDEIHGIVSDEPERIKISSKLRNLVESVDDVKEKEFLKEALDCYTVGGNRASIVMTWIAAMEHLKRHIYPNHLEDFNDALRSNPTKKLKEVISYEDFEELKEVKLIEVARASGIITKNQRFILNNKREIRNTCGHPNGVEVHGLKASEFIEDLVSNVITKL